MSYARRDTRENDEIKQDKGHETVTLQGKARPGKSVMIRLPFIERLVGLIYGKKNARSYKVEVLAASPQARQGSLSGALAATPGAAVAVLRAFGKAGSRPWLANQAGGRDVAQTPSNLG